jgi:hypothetical protein
MLQKNLIFERYIFNAHDIQRLDKMMETLQILYTFLYYYGVGPPFFFSTAAFLLGMDLYKF